MEDNYYKGKEPFFGNWTIERKLGQGASGKVFLIKLQASGEEPQYAALKAISIPNSEEEIESLMAEVDSPEDVEKYYEELVSDVVEGIQRVSVIEDKSHIVEPLEYEVVKKEQGVGWDIFIRFEYLTPLVNVMNEREFGEEEVTRLGIDICSALEQCEKVRMIHRDVKPENIFIAKDGRYMLGDFGIAKFTNKTEVGVSRKGTIEYMAPEVYNRELCDRTVDLYSLGLVMYKLLNNNRSPFMPAYPEPIRYVDRERAFGKRLKGGIVTSPMYGSEQLQKIVLTACSFIKTERFKSATDMKNALLAKENVQRPKARRKYIVLLTVLVLIGAVVAFPKGVNDITGVDEEMTIFLGQAVSPEYEVKPFFYRNTELAFDADSDIVTVSKDGSITGNKVGEAKVTVLAGNYYEQTKVTVLATVADIEGVDQKITMTEGDTLTIKPKLVPAKGADVDDEHISASIKDDDIATISDDMTITAKKAGSSVLALAAGGLSKEYSIEVEAKPEPVQVTYHKSKGKKKKSHRGGSFVNDTYF